jgi:transcriptional regulator
MYLPKHFAVHDRAVVRSVLRSTPFGHLVTGGGDTELQATPLPFVIDDDLTTVRAHFSRANPHWKVADGASALFIVPGVDGYVSPRWYPSKAEHGKVVPTWNYEVIHIRGTLTIHDSDPWKLALVSELTDHNEAELDAASNGTSESTGEPWQVSDAPEEFISGQLKAIVGVQLDVTEIIGKQKLSQNRSEADLAGAKSGLAASPRPGDGLTAAKMSGEG